MASSEPSLSSFLLLIFLLFSFSEAVRDILVGGKTDAWQIPPSVADSLNNWAEATRFKIGDSLVWKFEAQKDSVLEVTKENYESCNKTSPIAEYKDGDTKVKLDRSGPFYFISGAEGHCEKGQKLIVVVLAANHDKFRGIAPAPSPTGSAHGLRSWFVGSLVLLGSLVGMVLF